MQPEFKFKKKKRVLPLQTNEDQKNKEEKQIFTENQEKTSDKSDSGSFQNKNQQQINKEQQNIAQQNKEVLHDNNLIISQTNSQEKNQEQNNKEKNMIQEETSNDKKENNEIKKRDSFKQMHSYYPDVDDDYDLEIQKFLDNQELCDSAYSFLLYLQEKETQRIQEFLEENQYYKQIHAQLLSNIKSQLNQLKHQYKRRIYDSRPLIQEENPYNLKQQYKLKIIKKIGTDLIKQYHDIDKDQESLQDNKILKEILQDLFTDLKNSQNTYETSITEERIMEENVTFLLQNLETELKQKLQQRQNTLKEQAIIQDQLQKEDEKIQIIQQKLYQKFLGEKFEKEVQQWDEKQYLIDQEKDFQIFSK